MSAERKRRTNKLVREMATYVFTKQKQDITPEQIYGLCKLTWFARGNNTGINASYVKRTKIPALSLIFNKDFSNKSIEEVAREISKTLKEKEVEQLITFDTGFVNFYNAYRNCSLYWIQQNFETLLPLFEKAYNLSNDNDGLLLVQEIMKLKRIPNPNGANPIKPEYLITPVFFALDSRIRFPVINGNKNVKSLLRSLKIQNAYLDEQYSTLITLYGEKYGINDAADLDEICGFSDLIDIAGNNPTKKLLAKQPTDINRELPLKDESDLEVLQTATERINKRIHNQLTNKLKQCLVEYTLLEGCEDSVMFDVLVKKYDKENDLLIEVKSSAESANIRMAIGQLFHYWFNLKKDMKRHLAILIPNEPNDEIKNLLKSLRIGVLWFSGKKLKTCTKRLKHLTT